MAVKPVGMEGAWVSMPITVRVNEVILVSPPVAVPVIVTVYVPAGVMERVEIVRTVGQVGEQEVGEKEGVAPVGSPEVENETDWEVPETRVAVTELVTDEPWLTDLLPPLEREKSKTGGVVPVNSTAPMSGAIPEKYPEAIPGIAG